VVEADDVEVQVACPFLRGNKLFRAMLYRWLGESLCAFWQGISALHTRVPSSSLPIRTPQQSLRISLFAVPADVLKIGLSDLQHVTKVLLLNDSNRCFGLLCLAVVCESRCPRPLALRLMSSTLGSHLIRCGEMEATRRKSYVKAGQGTHVRRGSGMAARERFLR